MSQANHNQRQKSRGLAIVAITAVLIVAGGTFLRGFGITDNAYATRPDEQEADLEVVEVIDDDEVEVVTDPVDATVVEGEKELETKPVAPLKPEYVTVKDWEGTGSAQTEEFTITSEKWAISWSLFDPPEHVSPIFQIRVLNDDGSVAKIFMDSKEMRAAGTTYLNDGRDTYHLLVRSNMDWKLKIRQLVRPSAQVIHGDVDDVEAEVAPVAGVVPIGPVYDVIADWDGTGSMQTEPITIKSEKWAIKWSADNPPEQAPGVFQIRVFDEQGMVAKVIADTATERVSETTYFHNGPGAYYLRIRSNADWKIEVKELKPGGKILIVDDDEAELQKAREKIAKDKARLAAEKAANPEAYADKMAKEKLKMAKTLMPLDEATAKEWLREILADYPKTAAAQTAKQLLED